MNLELYVLAIACVFGIVQIYVAAKVEGDQYGTKWALSSRESELPPQSPLVGRMKRAAANFLETFPIAAAAILIIETGDLNNQVTAAGAVVWLAARAGFWVVYGIGIPVIRSVLFATSIVGIGMILSAVVI